MFCLFPYNFVQTNHQEKKAKADTAHQKMVGDQSFGWLTYNLQCCDSSEPRK
jgi:hypothetical protein